MTIYWKPVNENTIDVWLVQDNGTTTDIGPADTSNANGMPDNIGGVAPDAVRAIAAEHSHKQIMGGNSISINPMAAEINRDMQKMDYVRGNPP